MNEHLAAGGVFFLVGVFTFLSLPLWSRLEQLRGPHPQWHEFWQFCITGAGAAFILVPLCWFTNYCGGGQGLVLWAAGGLIAGALFWNLVFRWLAS